MKAALTLLAGVAGMAGVTVLGASGTGPVSACVHAATGAVRFVEDCLPHEDTVALARAGDTGAVQAWARWDGQIRAGEGIEAVYVPAGQPDGNLCIRVGDEVDLTASAPVVTLAGSSFTSQGHGSRPYVVSVLVEECGAQEFGVMIVDAGDGSHDGHAFNVVVP